MAAPSETSRRSLRCENTWILCLVVLVGFTRYSQQMVTVLPFTPATVNLPEGTTAVTRLADINIEGDTTNVHCNAFTTNTPFAIWRVNSSFQTLYAVYYVGIDNSPVGLSFVQRPSWFIEFYCNSTSGDHGNGTLEIDIIPNNAPVFLDFPSLDLDVTKAQYKAGTSLLTPRVRDADNDTLTFSFYTVPNLRYFNIDTRTGEIRNAVNLNGSLVQWIQLAVSVSDGRVTTGPMFYNLNLTFLLERPNILGLPQTRYVEENGPTFTLEYPVYRESNQDNNFGQLELNCFVVPESHFDHFRFQRDQNVASQGFQGIIRTSENLDIDIIKPFDYEDVASYSINCTVFDGFLYSAGEILTIIVRDKNEPPVFELPLYVVNIIEGQANDVSGLLDATVRDPDGDVISYVNFTAANNSQRFRYSHSQKRLYFTENYDIDLDNAYPTQTQLALQACDPEGLCGTTKVIVNVLDANDEVPQFVVTQGCSIDSNTALGPFLNFFQIVRDLDLTSPNNQVEVAVLRSEPPDQDYFDVTPSGQLHYVTQVADSLAPATVRMFLKATDKGAPRNTATAEIVCTIVTTTTTSTTTSTTTTTTASTTTTSTTTSTTTTTATTTTAATSTGLDGALIALIVLGSLLALALLAGMIYLLLRFCGCCGLGGAGPGVCSAGTCSPGGACYNGCEGFCNSYCECCNCCEKPPSPKVAPQRGRSDYQPDFWRTDDHYEDGRAPGGGGRPNSIRSIRVGVVSPPAPRPRPQPFF